MSDVARLRAEIEALGAETEALGKTTNAADRGVLEQRIIALCEAAAGLPAVEAKSLTEDLGRLIESLNAAEARMRASGVTSDSPAPRQSARGAAAAYGATAAARRRGS